MTSFNGHGVVCLSLFSYSQCYSRTRRGITLINPFTTGNPVLGTKLLGFRIGRGSGDPKGLTPLQLETRFLGGNCLELV